VETIGLEPATLLRVRLGALSSVLAKILVDEYQDMEPHRTWLAEQT
jgi:hypothetical protein